MPNDDTQPLPERQQTDESLRIEREKADLALSSDGLSVEEAADSVIARARARADRVLAIARAKSDRELISTLPIVELPAAVARTRRMEDSAVQEEREVADAALDEERADHASRLSGERRVTDRDLRVERARADASLATRDEFLGIVSHDLKNMVNTMAGFAALIAADVPGEGHVARVQRHAQRIQRSASRMNSLIGDLVDVASIEAGALAVTREVADASEVVAEAVDTFQALATTTGVSLRSDVRGPLPRILFDPARILQVLANLLSNAVKFTPGGGQVVVRVERLGDNIQFTVSDTGAGIPADKLEAIFGRFLQVESNDRRGVGLGLYISRAIVQGHGGRIWAGNRLDQGSTVSFTLPVQPPAAA